MLNICGSFVPVFDSISCVPALHINDNRNGDIILNALIAEFIALSVEHHMTGKVLETQDFYEASLCSNTIVSTWHERIRSTSNPPLGIRKLIDRHFAVLSVCGNLSKPSFICNSLYTMLPYHSLLHFLHTV